MQTQIGHQDIVIAGGLISSPAWAGWLGNINIILSTVSLLFGLALGATRLWQAYKNKAKDE